MTPQETELSKLKRELVEVDRQIAELMPKVAPKITGNIPTMRPDQTILELMRKKKQLEREIQKLKS